MIRRLGVIGLGLIGGSVASGAKRYGLVEQVVGYDRDPVNLAKADELGVIDQRASDIGEAARGSDVVMIAVPVGAFSGVLAELKRTWSDQTVYSDTGSTKRNVVDAARRLFGAPPPNFVPGHPIAGAERSGVEAATADLYAGKTIILTPGNHCSAESRDCVESLWSQLGAKVSLMDPDQHDAVLAATSHLPHVLAYTLVHLLGRKDEQDQIFQYAAGGFRDFTRIASSDPTMWLDICVANREHIVQMIEEFQSELDGFARLLQQRQEADIFEFLTIARSARQRYLTGTGN